MEDPDWGTGRGSVMGERPPGGVPEEEWEKRAVRRLAEALAVGVDSCWCWPWRRKRGWRWLWKEAGDCLTPAQPSVRLQDFQVVQEDTSERGTSVGAGRMKFSLKHNKELIEKINEENPAL